MMISPDVFPLSVSLGAHHSAMLLDKTSYFVPSVQVHLKTNIGQPKLLSHELRNVVRGILGLIECQKSFHALDILPADFVVQHMGYLVT